WPGYVERLGRLVQELGEEGIFDRAGLAARLRGAPSAVADALDRYSALLDELGLADPERALAAVAESEPPRLALLVVEGLHRLPALARRLIARLAEKAARTVAILDDDGAPEAIEPAVE